MILFWPDDDIGGNIRSLESLGSIVLAPWIAVPYGNGMPYNSCWDILVKAKRKGRGKVRANVIMLHPLGTINICTKCYHNICCRCWDIQSGQTCRPKKERRRRRRHTLLVPLGEIHFFTLLLQYKPKINTCINGWWDARVGGGGVVT